MYHFQDPLFQTIFDQLVEPRIVVKADTPEFTIATINRAYEEAVLNDRMNIVGRSLWEIFKDNVAGNSTTKVLREGLDSVLKSGEEVRLPLFRYDLVSSDGNAIPSWWQVEITPVIDPKGVITYLMCTTRNITVQVEGHEALQLSQQREVALVLKQEDLTDQVDELTESFNERLADETKTLSDSEYRLNRMVMTTPIGMTILKGRDFVVDIANKPILKLWGRTLEQVKDKSLLEVFPELEGQPFPDMLNNVFDTGKPVAMPEIAVAILSSDGQRKDLFVDFSYNPLFDLHGNVECILVTVHDVTEQVTARNLVQEQREELEALNEELATMNEELSASNEEINASNEELAAINEELRSSNEQIRELNDRLTISEDGFRSLIEQAPMPMFVFKGEHLRVDTVNTSMLALIEKSIDIVGKPLLEAMPELQGQPAFDALFEVYHTGKTIYGSESPVSFSRNGKEDTGYYTFTYSPLIQNGQIIGVIDMALEVTEQVKARQSLEKIIEDKTAIEKQLSASEQRLQSILDTMAEGVGIIDTSGQLVYANPMAQRILGLTESEIKERTYHDPKWQNLRIDGSPLPPDEHPMSVTMRTGMPIYDQEVAVQPPNGERFYVSINAAPIFDQETGTLTGGIGTFMDVTNRRKLMMQKDDFIGVASHELKTPVTSLKASLQLLARMKDTIKPDMLSKLVSQSTRSLDKLSNLISELLDTNRISQGQLQIHRTTFSIADMVRDCCDHIRTAGTHEIILKGDMNLKIYADEQQLDQVLVNFVNNAVKYAPDSKEIIIEVTQLDGVVKVAVTDQGPGIPPGKKPHLFDRYYRADYSGVQFSGLGLGLYICAEIIKKHGGEIGVDSELGKGSTFWFTVPIN